MYTYLKFGLPRVLPPGKEEGVDNSSGYDSTDEEVNINIKSNIKSKNKSFNISHHAAFM